MKKAEKEKQAAIDYLKNDLGIKPGDTIQCILRSVSRSGMNRKISVIYNGENISWHVSKLFGYKPAEKFGHWAVNVSGCGMDMGFHIVYMIGRYLFPDGFIPKEAGRYGRNGTPDTELDTDGGYALKHQWL